MHHLARKLGWGTGGSRWSGNCWKAFGTNGWVVSKRGEQSALDDARAMMELQDIPKDPLASLTERRILGYPDRITGVLRHAVRQRRMSRANAFYKTQRRQAIARQAELVSDRTSDQRVNTRSRAPVPGGTAARIS